MKGDSGPIMVVHLYKRDVDALLEKAPPEGSPLWNMLENHQQNLIDALKHAREETYE